MYIYMNIYSFNGSLVLKVRIQSRIAKDLLSAASSGESAFEARLLGVVLGSPWMLGGLSKSA